MQPFGCHDRPHAPAQVVVFLVQIGLAFLEDPGNGLGHRAVEIDRHFGNLLALAELGEKIDDFLGAPQGKSGNHNLAPAGQSAVHGHPQIFPFVAGVFVQAVAVRALGNQDVDVRDLDRIVQQRQIVAAEVEDQRDTQRRPFRLRNFQPGQGCAEDVPGIDMHQPDAAGQDHGLAIGMRLDEADGRFGICEGVEGNHRRLIATVGLLVQVGGIGFLNVGRIAQHDGQEVRRGRGRVNGIAISVFSQGGNVAAMIDVCMRKHHGIDAGRTKSQIPVDFLGFLAPALKQAAIKQDARLLRFQEMFRARDLVCAAEKMPLHAVPGVGPFSLWILLIQSKIA